VVFNGVGRDLQAGWADRDRSVRPVCRLLLHKASGRGRICVARNSEEEGSQCVACGFISRSATLPNCGRREPVAVLRRIGRAPNWPPPNSGVPARRASPARRRSYARWRSGIPTGDGRTCRCQGMHASSGGTVVDEVIAPVRRGPRGMERMADLLNRGG
jgi:hypothetical protein